MGDAPSLRITLYTRFPDALHPAAVEREIPYVRGIVRQIRAAVTELTVPMADVPALLPEGTRVLDVAFTADGTAYLDFSSELDNGRAVGPEDENLLVQAIVATVTENFKAIRQVIILVDGKVPRLFHLDLTQPQRRDAAVFAAGGADEGPTDPGEDPGEPAASGAAAAKPRPAATPEPRL